MAKRKAVSKKRTRKSNNTLDNEVITYIWALVVITLSVIGILKVGVVGKFLYHCCAYVAGELAIVIFAFIIFLIVYYSLKKSIKEIFNKYFWALTILFLVILTYLSLKEFEVVGMKAFDLFTTNSKIIFDGSMKNSGGFLGTLLYSLSSVAFDRVGTYIVLFVLLVFDCLLVLSKEKRQTLKNFLVNIPKNIKEKREERKLNIQDIDDPVEAELIDYEEPEEEVLNGKDFADLLENRPGSGKNSEGIVEDTPVTSNQQPVTNKVQNDSTPIYDEFTNYVLPKMNLLATPVKTGKNGNSGYANEAGKRLVHILKEFGVDASLVATHIGPTVTKFEVRPEVGVRVNKISNLEQDIKMGLAAKDIRIEAPIPGKSTVGIEIPNQEKTLVNIKEVLRGIPESKQNSKLCFALGKDLMGNAIFGELNKMPHLLIAGATGSGKSVCVNSIIVSILMRANPSEVKLLLIDPKKVEFTPFHELPHLLGPVITDAEEASRALKVVVELMEKRYEVFSKVGVRNISGYNDYLLRNPSEQLKKMPWIVVIIDELADLMLVAAKDVEASIQRITQLARAAGIHLIVATQRPSVDVITGLIKSNIPSRIAFAVSSAVDSRTIIDMTGAEQLLGLGDMLYMPQGENAPLRVQGCFVSEEEVKHIAEYCARQAKPKYEDTFIKLDAVDKGGAVQTSNDPIYEDVKRFVIENGKASTSFIQRKFSLGYARAARLVDMLEAQGIVGPANGSKPREVYVKSDIYDDNESEEE